MPQSNLYYAQTSATLGPTTAAAVGEYYPAANYRNVAIVISGLSTETISVTGALDGFDAVRGGTAPTNYSAAVRPIDANTGALAAASALGNGTYVFASWPFASMKFTKSAGVDTVTIRVIARNF